MYNPKECAHYGSSVTLKPDEHRIRTRGIQFYFLVFVSTLLVYELIVQIFIHPPGRPIPLSEKAYKRTQAASSSFSVEIFSAPKPFLGEDSEVNLRAIKSWQNLSPKPKITLLGYETGYDTIATEYGLNVYSEIDTTFLGVPLFNSMVNIANQSTATVAVIVNGDIILLQDFIDSLRTILSRFDDFLAIGARYDLPSLPSGLTQNDPNFYKLLGAHVRENGTLHTYGGMDLWAWNPQGSRLFDPEMPHFIFGRGKYDNWLTHETIAARRRTVIDASEAMLSIHIRHGYKHVKQGGTRGQTKLMTGGRRLLVESKSFWSERKKTKFELFINIYLSLHVGTYENQHGTILFAPWRLARCLEERGNCFVRRLRPGVCNCEYSPTCAKTQTDQVYKNGSRVIRCGTISFEESEDYDIPVSGGYDRSGRFGMPLTLSSIAERIAIDDTIILTAASFGFRDILMNWICNMRRLKITNFAVAALDADIYRFAFVRGLPIYLDDGMDANSREGLNSSAAVLLRETTYGSPEFFQLASLKSRIIIDVLKMGYDVVWSDTDVIWFRNPIAHLQTFGADLAVQSDAGDDEAANTPRRLSNAFYLVRANSRTIRVFEEIFSHASSSRVSEQVCFSDVLCGEEGERRLGNDSCVTGGSNVKVLDRTLYPNGETQGIWDVTPGTMESAFSHIYIVHNNMVHDMDQKWDRVKRHGFIFFEQKSSLCLYDDRGSVRRSGDEER